jgi:RNA polymerase sigma-70 factor (sigma-E family)
VSDDGLFADFVRTHTPALSRTAYLLTGSRASAEDLVQETFVRLYRRKEWLLAADAPVAYARRALTNQFVNDRRRAASREIVLADVPESGRAHGDHAGALANRDALWQLLATLPERQRAAIVLRFYEDLPDEEIAAAIEARVGTVRSLISRGLATLRNDPAMANFGGGERSDGR